MLIFCKETNFLRLFLVISLFLFFTKLAVEPFAQLYPVLHKLFFRGGKTATYQQLEATLGLDGKALRKSGEGARAHMRLCTELRDGDTHFLAELLRAVDEIQIKRKEFSNHILPP